MKPTTKGRKRKHWSKKTDDSNLNDIIKLLSYSTEGTNKTLTDKQKKALAPVILRLMKTAKVDAATAIVMLSGALQRMGRDNLSRLSEQREH